MGARRLGTDTLPRIRVWCLSPEQYVDRLNGEPARRQACRSGVSAIAVEAFVNNTG
jgi:hypothetical protein